MIEFKDISGIEFGCTHCGALVLYPIAKVDRQIMACPNCNENWFKQDVNNVGANSLIKEFVTRLEGIIKRPDIQVKLRLQIALTKGV